MSEIKQRALEKMNEEMSKQHTFAVDAIHNWLCVQEDDELFEGICKEGNRTDKSQIQSESTKRSSKCGGNLEKESSNKRKKECLIKKNIICDKWIFLQKQKMERFYSMN